MMKYTVLLAIVLLASSFAEGVVLCYHGSWSAYFEGDGSFQIEDIDPFLCTHLIYSFASLSEENIIVSGDPETDLCDPGNACGYQRFSDLKQANPELKTIISIGGWNDGSEKYSAMAADPTARGTFIDSVLTFLETYNFDGLDFDWEFPTQRGGIPEDKANFATLLEELGSAFSERGYLLSTAVSANKQIIDEAYDVARISNVVDFVNLMTYDFHGSWETYTHHHTLLYPYPQDEGDNTFLNVDFAVNYWLEQGAAASKLVMGTATFGNSWTLDNPEINGMYAPASQPGAGGPYTQSPGTIAFNELCMLNLNSPWTIVHEPNMNEPYAFDFNYGNTWAGYDDPESIAKKASYAASKNLAGVMVWSIDGDDFQGACGPRFVLIQTLKDTFNGTVAARQ